MKEKDSWLITPEAQTTTIAALQAENEGQQALIDGLKSLRPETEEQHWQADADALTRLSLRGFLPKSEFQKIKAKLLKARAALSPAPQASESL